MRVQPARPRSPLTTTVTERCGARSAACSAAQRPAPPAPRIRMSVSTTSMAPSAETLTGHRLREVVEEGLLRSVVPGAGARDAADEPHVAADDVDRREGPDAVVGAHAAIRVEEHHRGEAALLHPGGHLLLLLLDVDSDHGELPLASLTLHLVDGRGQLRGAVGRGRRPEVEQDHVPGEIREGHPPPVETEEREGRRLRISLSLACSRSRSSSSSIWAGAEGMPTTAASAKMATADQTRPTLTRP